MASKNFIIDEDIALTIYKRRKNRNLRLSIAASGQVRVTIPAWAPYSTGLNFARLRLNWIREQVTSPALLRNGQAIGKAHHLEFCPSSDAINVSGRVKDSKVIVRMPTHLTPDSPECQDAAKRASVRALRSQAEQLLPQRLDILAHKHGFTYNRISIKLLKSRWGSCDQESNIVLNLYLMQLPWELIDYVLLHELMHTEMLRHGPDFWSALKHILPDVQELRKAVRNHQPVLDSIS